MIMEPGRDIQVITDDDGDRSAVLQRLRDGFSDAEYRAHLEEDCERIEARPDLLEFKVRTRALKQAVRLNRKLVRPLRSPLLLENSVVLCEARDWLEGQTDQLPLILINGAVAAIYRGERERSLPHEMPQPWQALLLDLWPGLEQKTWTFLACAGTRIMSPAPGLLSHLVCLSSDGIAAQIACLRVMETSLAEESAPRLIAAGTTDAVERVEVVDDEQAWALLSTCMREAEAVRGTIESPDARASSQLRFVIAFQGRGRVSGDLDPRGLVRLGISRWR